MATVIFPRSRARWLNIMMIFLLGSTMGYGLSAYLHTRVERLSPPTIDRLVDEANSWIHKQRFFTAVNGGNFKKLKDFLKHDSQYRALVAMSVVHKAMNKMPLQDGRSQSSITNPDAILAMGNPSCLQFVIVFRAVLDRLGLKSRTISLMYPNKSLLSHAVAEAFYNGGWHLFDPTFRAFYTRSGKLADSALSLREILADPSLVSKGFTVFGIASYQQSYEFVQENYPREVLADLRVDLNEFKNGLFRSPTTYSESEIFIDGKKLEK